MLGSSVQILIGVPTLIALPIVTRPLPFSCPAARSPSSPVLLRCSMLWDRCPGVGTRVPSRFGHHLPSRGSGTGTKPGHGMPQTDVARPGTTCSRHEQYLIATLELVC